LRFDGIQLRKGMEGMVNEKIKWFNNLDEYGNSYFIKTKEEMIQFVKESDLKFNFN
jgi:hypothetical protein